MSTPASPDPLAPPSDERPRQGWRLALPDRVRESIRLPRSHRRRSEVRRIVLGVLAALAALLLLLTIDAVWSGRTMLRGVSTARSELTEGSVAAVTGDPGASIPHFERAAEAADSALSAGDHPSMALLERVPWLGDNIRAVSAVAEAERRSADAGLAMAEVARTLGWNDLRLPASEAIGRVDLDALRAAEPGFDTVATELGTALAQARDRRHRPPGRSGGRRVRRRPRHVGAAGEDRARHPRPRRVPARVPGRARGTPLPAGGADARPAPGHRGRGGPGRRAHGASTAR